MSDKITYPITVYRFDCGELIERVFTEECHGSQRYLNGERFEHYVDGEWTFYSTDYEKTKKDAIEQTEQILSVAEKNVNYYTNQLVKLKELK